MTPTKRKREVPREFQSGPWSIKPREDGAGWVLFHVASSTVMGVQFAEDSAEQLSEIIKEWRAAQGGEER